MTDEHVLVIPTSAVIDQLGGGSAWLGIRPTGEDALADLIRRTGEFRPRSLMEADESFKQVIPYPVLRDGAAWFLMTRREPVGPGTAQRFLARPNTKKNAPTRITRTTTNAATPAVLKASMDSLPFAECSGTSSRMPAASPASSHLDPEEALEDADDAWTQDRREHRRQDAEDQREQELHRHLDRPLFGSLPALGPQVL